MQRQKRAQVKQNNMNLYKKILDKSKSIDWENKPLKNLSFSIPVAKTHPRYKKIEKYTIKFGSVSKIKFGSRDLVLADQAISDRLNIKKQRKFNLELFTTREDNTKTLNSAERILIKYFDKKIKKVVIIGGGVLSDFGGYIAEKLNSELVLVPTTIIGMADACMGGKVRMNFVDAGRYIKHYYKSFYEPNKVIIDFDFIKTLNKKQISIGMAETIKHAITQSPRLFNYLLSDSFQPFSDKESLKRAIVWTIDLKSTCLKIDPEESVAGARKIIHFAHEFTNQIEVKSMFKVSHGEALERAMPEEFKKDKLKLKQIKALYSKLEINI